MCHMLAAEYLPTETYFSLVIFCGNISEGTFVYDFCSVVIASFEVWNIFFTCGHRFFILMILTRLFLFLFAIVCLFELFVINLRF